MNSICKQIFRTREFKIYPKVEQQQILESWMESACWLYNLALSHRIKAYKRRKESIKTYDQFKLLTGLRTRVKSVKLLPVEFGRDALRRVEQGFKRFFSGLTRGRIYGFPRFKSKHRYNSLECVIPRTYIYGNSVRVPVLGKIRLRGGPSLENDQKSLRIIRRASGWYIQIVVSKPYPKSVRPSGFGVVVGVDLGLNKFATLDNGKAIDNPRYFRIAERKLRSSQRRVARRRKTSIRRKKSSLRLNKLYEKIHRQRIGFCHRIARGLINQYSNIAIENLNIKSLARSKLAKSVQDACWGTFVRYLTYKAEEAGRVLVKVDPRGTSQECPRCGTVAPKKLSERIHHCGSCGFRCDRDQAAAMVIRQRAFGPAHGGLVRPSTPNGGGAGPVKRGATSNHDVVPSKML